MDARGGEELGELRLLARVGRVPDGAGGGGAGFENGALEGGGPGCVAEDVVAELVRLNRGKWLAHRFLFQCCHFTLLRLLMGGRNEGTLSVLPNGRPR